MRRLSILLLAGGVLAGAGPALGAGPPAGTYTGPTAGKVTVVGTASGFQVLAAEPWTLGTGCKVAVGDVIVDLKSAGGDLFDVSEGYYSNGNAGGGERGDGCTRTTRVVGQRKVTVSGKSWVLPCGDLSSACATYTLASGGSGGTTGTTGTGGSAGSGGSTGSGGGSTSPGAGGSAGGKAVIVTGRWQAVVQGGTAVKGRLLKITRKGGAYEVRAAATWKGRFGCTVKPGTRLWTWTPSGKSGFVNAGAYSSTEHCPHAWVKQGVQLLQPSGNPKEM